ncbi:MAG: glycoside hydrolase family 125 protein, partial [Clostridia bacterium]|nr:glycoside hydrolase family 125 protein [Clostridia bacterium]
AILTERYIIKGIERILSILDSEKNERADLYETFLQPTDDLIVYPYLTYDNVLVWKALLCIAEMMTGIKEDQFCCSLKEQAGKIKEAVWEHCVFELDGKKIFAWSTDLEGRWNVYDEPPGSLQLLPFYGFCSSADEVYRNTVEYIRRPEYKYSFYGFNIAEIGCAHAPHPWVLSIANSLLCGRKKEFEEMLPWLTMDQGIACESVDEDTGECATGEAFATCAGFLAYSLYQAFYTPLT